MILVAGATGTTGREVVRGLLASGVAVRGLTRSEEGAALVRELGAEPVVGDLGDPGSLARALRGVERLYVAMPATEHHAQLEENAYAVAEQSGAYAVVKLGVLGQSPQGPVRFQRTHAEAFAALQASSLRWTLLQPAGFQQSFGRAPEVASARGSARVAYVDARDVAEVAVQALVNEGHEACTYTLTGPEALTTEEVAAALGLPHRAATPEELVEAMTGAGVDRWRAEGLAELDAFYADSGGVPPTPDVEAVLGRQPRSFADG